MAEIDNQQDIQQPKSTIPIDRLIKTDIDYVVARLDLRGFSLWLPGEYRRTIPDMDDKTRQGQEHLFPHHQQIGQAIDKLISDTNFDLPFALTFSETAEKEWSLMNQAADSYVGEKGELHFFGPKFDRLEYEYHEKRARAYEIVFHDMLRPLFRGMLALGFDWRELTR